MGQRTFIWNVDVGDSYDGFLREVQRRVATQVASRTLGHDGRPVHREIVLTQDNPSLRNTYASLLALGMDRADIRAVFHTSATGRVESITFAPPIVPVRPTTITASPPRRPNTPPRRPNTPRRRRDRGEESTGEVGGVPGLREGGRYFYGIHTTGHNTMCYGRYDNLDDVCEGVETENTMALRLHYDQGERDLMYLMRSIGTDAVLTDGYQTRLNIYTRRMNNGRRANGPLADRIYREGALEGYRRARMANPNLPKIL